MTRTYSGMTADQRRERRKEALLRAGLDLLGSNGWHATTVSAVCRHARLTPRYFYESFSDREALLLAVFDAILREVADEAAECMAQQPATIDALVRCTVAAWVNGIQRDPRKGRAVFVEALGSEALMQARLDATRRLATTLADRARDHDAVLRSVGSSLDVAAAVVAGGLVETLVEWTSGALQGDAARLIDDYARASTAALRASASE